MPLQSSGSTVSVIAFECMVGVSFKKNNFDVA
jgi:hypothetical protein